jgi:hypothetical protein
MWLVAAASLASLELIYGHLQQMGLWPLELIASSLWRFLGAHAGATEATVWGGPAALILVGLLAEILAWTARRPSLRRASEGDDHE